MIPMPCSKTNDMANARAFCCVSARASFSGIYRLVSTRQGAEWRTCLLGGSCEIEKDGPDGGHEEEDEDGRQDQEHCVPVQSQQSSLKLS